MAKVAVVTGGNKGIGYAAVKSLAQKVDGIVYLTARNEELGKQAVENLRKELGSPNGDKIIFHKLDVTKMDAVHAFKCYLEQKHSGIDILINNAGISINDETMMPILQKTEITLGVNYYGVKNVCHALFPLLRSHARVVIVASRAGSLRCMEDVELQKKLLDENLMEQDIDTILHQYIKAIEEGKHEEKGYPLPYSMSKIAAIVLGRIQNRDIQKDLNRPDIVVNSCCPGLVATDMTAMLQAKHNVKIGDELMPGVIVKTIEEGADTPVYLALLPPNTQGPKGEFVAEREVLNWATLPTMKEGFAAIDKAKADAKKAEQ